jgi:diguanylate cyclase (GGDEF)-like protein/PAS domain S-box-containing protein
MEYTLSPNAQKHPAYRRVLRQILRYGFAFLTVAVAAAVRYWMGKSIGSMPPYVVFFPATALVAYEAGLGPGIAATLLSALTAAFFFIEPIGSFAVNSPAEIFRLVAFVILGILLSIFTDRGRRRKAQLAHVKEHLAEAQQLAQIGSWELDFASGRIAWSDQTYRIFGLPIGSTPLTREQIQTQIVHPADRQRIAATWAEELKAGAYLKEYRIVVQGKTRWVRSRARIEFSPSGDPQTALGTVQDITREKLAEEKVAHLAAIVDTTSDAVIGKSMEGIVTSWNRGAEQIYGYTPEEMIGQPIARLTPPDRKDETSEILARIMCGERLHHFETQRLRKDGSRIEISLSVSPIHDGAGQIVGASAIARDITEHKREEDEIAALAFHDPLTKLPNRRMFFTHLQQALAASARSGRHSALLFVDLDDFKRLNDTLGHDAGDELLQQVGYRLVDCLREQDVVCRLGGDEFVVLLRDLSENPQDAFQQASIVGEKMCAILERPHLLSAHTYVCTASIGLTLFNGQDETQEEVLRRADQAMYRAKCEGKSQLRSFVAGV